MADYSTELARLRGLLNSGATSVTTDGQSVAVDHASIRRRIRELEALDEATVIPRRPRATSIDLSGF